MPPMMASDDESDDIDVPDAIPAKPSKIITRREREDEVNDEGEDEEEDGEEEEDEEDGEEYVVEKIVDHNFDKKGNIIYKIKWHGYNLEADMTWEPSENLEHAPGKVDEYKSRIGGTPEPPTKSAKKKGTAKRSNAKRAADESPAPVSNKKKKSTRKGEADTSETNGTEKKYAYPEGIWEDSVEQVVSIIHDTQIDLHNEKPIADPQLYGYLRWNDGHQSKHPMRVLKAKCPQKLLTYYEQHLSFEFF